MSAITRQSDKSGALQFEADHEQTSRRGYAASVGLLNRREMVLRRMREAAAISDGMYRRASVEPTRIKSGPRT
jgi:exopolysaccharide biosynthesis protein